ncbi:pectinesterase [Ranunculus cassubicifolius]
MGTNFIFLSFLLLAFIISSCLADVNHTTPATTPVAPNVVCNATLYPKFCKSVLPHAHNETSDIREYSRFSVRRSLSAARKFLSLIEKYLRRRSKLSETAIRALEACHLLAGLNIDFLASTMQTLNSTKPLLMADTDDLQTLLSAIVTNIDTCSDGIKSTASSWSLKNGLYTPLSNGTKLFSVSLSLFSRGWIHKNKKCRKSCGRLHPGRKLIFSDTELVQNGPLPMRMSNEKRKIFESFRQRKLLQTDEYKVLISDVVIVCPDGTGNFTNINEAVNAAPNNTVISDGYFLIYIAAGVYQEYVSIAKNKKYVMMLGEGINQTIITGNRSFVDGWPTFTSATFAVVGEGFVALNITFRNTAGAIKHQAVAVRNGADLSTFYWCSFEGYQDTLYTHSLRQFYRNCDIYGTVDFIFGNAAVVFQNCKIYARLPMANQFNAVTAQGRTDPDQNTGISIQNCSILQAPELASSNGTTQTYLGRPWKEYSRTVYMQSFLDKFINPLGWIAWNGSFALNTSYYAEYNNTGRGSRHHYRVTWPGFHVLKNATVAANFTVTNFIQGDDWLPNTAVAYVGGLL